MRAKTFIIVGFLLFSAQTTFAQTPPVQQSRESVNGVQLVIGENGLIKPGIPNLQVTFRNVSDRDLNINLGEIGGGSPRPCKIEKRTISCNLNFKLNVSNPSGATRTYTFRGIGWVAGRLDAYIVNIREHSAYTLELGLDQFWSPQTNEYRPPELAPGTYELSLEFEGRAPSIINLDQRYIERMTFWQGKVISNSLSMNVGPAQ
jgi:hypothetical protein